nr:Chain C, Influenza Nucleoprotein [Influenza A virus]
SRYWAIRTR